MKEYYDSPSLKEIIVNTVSVFNSINAWGDGGTTVEAVQSKAAQNLNEGTFGNCTTRQRMAFIPPD